MPKTRITLNGLGSPLDHMWITSGSHIEKTVAHMLSRVRLPVGAALCGDSRSLSLSALAFVFRGAGIGPSLLSDPWGAQFKEALGTHGLTCIMGDDASAQPGNLQDVLLHETAVSWLRLRLAASTPARCWEEAPVQYTSRLKRCCDDVNQNLKVDDLCNAWPKRIRKVRDLEGGRLKS